MKLDLLYEIDVPRPWPGRTRTASARHEQRAYAEAIEQIKLADKLGFNTCLARRAPLPRGTLALAGARGDHRRAVAVHREPAARLRCRR